MAGASDRRSGGPVAASGLDGDDPVWSTDTTVAGGRGETRKSLRSRLLGIIVRMVIGLMVRVGRVRSGRIGLTMGAVIRLSILRDALMVTRLSVVGLASVCRSSVLLLLWSRGCTRLAMRTPGTARARPAMSGYLITTVVGLRRVRMGVTPTVAASRRLRPPRPRLLVGGRASVSSRSRRATPLRWTCLPMARVSPIRCVRIARARTMSRRVCRPPARLAGRTRWRAHQRLVGTGQPS